MIAEASFMYEECFCSVDLLRVVDKKVQLMIFSALNDANSLGAISLNGYSGYLVIMLELIFCLLIVVYIIIIKYKR